MKRFYRSFVFWLTLLAVLAMLPKSVFEVAVTACCVAGVALWPWAFGMTKGSRR